jgi:hypothetical protein
MSPICRNVQQRIAKSLLRKVVPTASPLILFAFAFLNLSHASGEAAKEPALSDLTACQQAYCEGLRDMFAMPIDWRLVLDTSGSYAGKPQTKKHMTEELAALLRELPLETGDQIAIDAFDSTYRPTTTQSRGLTPCLFPTPTSDFAGSSALVIESCLTKLLPNLGSAECSNAAPPSACYTDFIQSIAAMKSERTTGQSSKRRTFFIVLTDGQNEPREAHKNPPNTLSSECASRHSPLFSPGSGFTNHLLTFNDSLHPTGPSSSLLTRGLLFLLTPRPQAEYCKTIPETIEEDWEVYSRYLREIARSNTMPAVVRHRAGEDYHLEPLLRTLVRRDPGSLPCLAPALGSPFRASGPYSLSPPCLSLFNRRPLTLRLSPEELSDAANGLPLNVTALSRGNSLPQIVAKTTSSGETLKLISLDTHIPTNNASPNRWNLTRLAGTLPVSQHSFREATSAIELKLESSGDGATKQELILSFLPPNPTSLIASFFGDRERAPLVLAAIFLFTGMYASFKYFRALQTSLIVFAARHNEPVREGSASKRATLFPRDNMNPVGLRYQVTPGPRPKIVQCSWAPGGLAADPHNCRDCKSTSVFHIDLHLLSAQPYFVCWNDESPRPRLIRAIRTFCHNIPFSILTPGGCWLPTAEGSRAPVESQASWRRWLLPSLEWSDSVELELDKLRQSLELRLELFGSARSFLLDLLATFSFGLAGFLTIVAAASLLLGTGSTLERFLRWWPYLVAVIVLRILLLLGLPLLVRSFLRPIIPRLVRTILAFRAFASHLLLAMFLSSVVESVSANGLGSWCIYFILFLCCSFLGFHYFSQIPRRRLEQSRPLREADFWLDSTFWLWGHVNI